MRSLLIPLIPLVAVCGIVSSVLELSSQSLFERALKSVSLYRATNQGGIPAASFSEDERENSLRSLKVQRAEALDLSQRAAEGMLTSARAESSYASLLRQFAENEPNVEKRIEFYCAALAQFGNALAKDPRNSRILMSWANIRQLLGSVKCALPTTEGSYQSTIVAAMANDPTNVESKYAAGLILLWGGEREQGWKLFNEVLRFGTELSPLQQSAIFREIKDDISLRAITPARFPQILTVSEYLERNPLSFGADRRRYSSFMTTLQELQLEALRTSVAEYEQDLIPFDVHFDRLYSMVDLRASSEVRQQLDRELSSLVRLRGQQPLALYLQERGQLQELRIERATIASDTRPHKTPLLRWGLNEKFFLDEFYRSVGFFLGEEQSTRIIELKLPTRPASSVLSSLRILVSDDNAVWEEITGLLKAERYDLGRSSLIVYRVPPKSAHYWKIHFSSSTKEKQLGSSLDSMVNVYGSAYGPEYGTMSGSLRGADRE